MNTNTYFYGAFQVSRLSFGIYESLSGGWLSSSDENQRKITCIDVGPVDDFGSIRSFSDGAAQALEVSFNN